MADPERAITLRVKRFDPQADRRPRWRAYTLAPRPRMSVLDALFEVLEHQDATLAFRFSCRAGMCGACAMIINGREDLSCRVRLERIANPVSVEPLRSLPVIKDLLVDMAPFFAKYRAVDPFFVGDEPLLSVAATDPAPVPPDSPLRLLIDQQIDCIACGACYSACPVVAVDGKYLGPAALNRAFALRADVREARTNEERAALVSGDGGVYACRGVGNCVTVCPVGVDPLLSIRLLRGARNV